MKAKEYLRGYRVAQSKVETVRNNLQLLREKRDSISISMDGMPHGTGISDKTGNLAAAIAAAEEELKRMERIEVAELETITNTILNLSNPDYIDILRLRYIDGMTWERIAVTLHFSYRWVCVLHGRALEEVNKVLGNS